MATSNEGGIWMRPRICILKTDGVNCDEETSYAFTKASGSAEIVHINKLKRRGVTLQDYQILALPGGFSYGDDISSGKILAVELISFLKDQLEEFISSGKLVIGICNGFQVLVKTGLLPFNRLGNLEVTLTTNRSGRFCCDWTQMQVLKSPCVFTQGMEGTDISLQVAHGEGRFQCDEKMLRIFRIAELAPLRYINNPNGSIGDIAGICDPTGRIFGLMPHPERFVRITQHPNWRRISGLTPTGLIIFQNAVNFAAKTLC